MEQLKFNHQSEFYKKPFGAIKNGENFEIKIEIENSLANGTPFIYIVFRKDKTTIEKKFKLIKRVYEENNPYQIYSSDEIKIEEPGLYFYRFEIAFRDKFFFVGRDNNDNAKIADWLSEWSVLIYEKNFETPSWLENAIIYQIFPDRFNKSVQTTPVEIKNNRIIHDDWYERPYFIYDFEDKEMYHGQDFFGGNLRGIVEKLPYISSLGTTIIYLNPIFESSSNHRYDTGNYFKVDPLLGTNEDFSYLCSEAKKLGIKIIIDGVFSHTGDDSVYFNRFSHYDSIGAFNSPDSPYYSWYNFNDGDNSTYDCWWGFKSLPCVNECNEKYLDFICSETGVLNYWQKLGAAGWRLDVVDELPDEFLEKLRIAVKRQDKDAYILGEVWENAVTKESYGERRKFLLGNQLDSSMNYPFKDNIFELLISTERDKTKHFISAILDILELYPPEAIKGLQNMLSSHDTQRAITFLACSKCEIHVDCELKGDFKLNSDYLEIGKSMFRLATMIQYFLPGIPSIFYGDEAGLEGFSDPWNRVCYPYGKEDERLIEFFVSLGKLKKENKDYFQGKFFLEEISENILTLSFSSIKKETIYSKLLLLINISECEFNYNLKESKIIFTDNLDNYELSGGILKLLPEKAVIIKSL